MYSYPDIQEMSANEKDGEIILTSYQISQYYSLAFCHVKLLFNSFIIKFYDDTKYTIAVHYPKR